MATPDDMEDRRSAPRGGDGALPGANMPLRDALRWAIESGDGAMAAADWLVRDLYPGCRGAIDLVIDPATPLEILREAKEAFKTMRLVGERATDRQVGGSFYVATIAAALAHHGSRITTQDDANVRRAIQRLADDPDQPAPLRAVAAAALAGLPHPEA